MQRVGKLAWCLLLSLWVGVIGASVPAFAESGVSLYTPYTSLVASPGETINYSVDVINNSDAIQAVELGVDAGANKWNYNLTAGGRKIEQISVKPKESQSVNVELEVPLAVNKGDYTFNITAKGFGSLPLKVKVEEQGTYKSELTTDQPNMEGHADSTFTFSATLKNRTVEKQLYALRAAAPEGWDVQFSSGGKNVSSVSVDPNATSSISLEVHPPEKVAAGSYKIPVEASTSSTTASAEFEIVVTGTYGIKLSTPNDLLSTSVTAGSDKKLDLVVTNTGTSELRDISLSSQAPVDWEVSFEPKTIRSLAAGKTASVQATIKADKKSIAGDYVVNMTASTAEKSSDAQFRVAVQTSVLWGWLGAIIIVVVLAGIYYLFRKYGRR